MLECEQSNIEPFNEWRPIDALGSLEIECGQRASGHTTRGVSGRDDVLTTELTQGRSKERVSWRVCAFVMEW